MISRRKIWVLQIFKIEIEIIQLFCRIASPKKLAPHPSLTSANFKKLRKVLRNCVECLEMR